MSLQSFFQYNVKTMAEGRILGTNAEVVDQMTVQQVAWAARCAPPLLHELFVQLAWHKLTVAQQVCIARRLAAGTCDARLYRPMARPRGPSPTSEVAILTCTREEVLGLGLSHDPTQSPLWPRYGPVLSRAGPAFRAAVVLVCRLDIELTSAGQGRVIVGPSTTGPTFGVIAAGLVSEGFLDLLGTWRDADDGDLVVYPDVLSPTGRILVPGALLSEPAVVRDGTTLGRPPNARLTMEGEKVWMHIYNDVRSCEILMQHPRPRRIVKSA